MRADVALATFLRSATFEWGPRVDVTRRHAPSAQLPSGRRHKGKLFQPPTPWRNKHADVANVSPAWTPIGSCNRRAGLEMQIYPSSVRRSLIGCARQRTRAAGRCSLCRVAARPVNQCASRTSCFWFRPACELLHLAEVEPELDWATLHWAGMRCDEWQGLYAVIMEGMLYKWTNYLSGNLLFHFKRATWFHLSMVGGQRSCHGILCTVNYCILALKG